MKKEEKMQKTKEEYNKIRSDMSKAGFVETEHIISKTKASVVGIFISLIITIIMGVLYRILNGASLDFELNYPIFLLIAVVSIVVHELVHGLAWGINSKQGFKSIKFGLNSSLLILLLRLFSA